MVAAAHVLALCGLGFPSCQGATLPAILLSAAVFFAGNHLLAGVVRPPARSSAMIPYLRDDFVFQAWTGGSLLSRRRARQSRLDARQHCRSCPSCPSRSSRLTRGRHAALASHRALHDALTDLPNRAMLFDRLKTASADADEGTMLSADPSFILTTSRRQRHARHEFGDLVLQRVAGRLKEALGPSRCLAGLSGDEFALVLEDVDSEEQATAEAKALITAPRSPA